MNRIESRARAHPYALESCLRGQALVLWPRRKRGTTGAVMHPPPPSAIVIGILGYATARGPGEENAGTIQEQRRSNSTAQRWRRAVDPCGITLVGRIKK